VHRQFSVCKQCRHGTGCMHCTVHRHALCARSARSALC